MLNFGLSQGGKVSKAKETGSPLNKHPSWTQVGGIKPDHFGWADYGNKIVFYKRYPVNSPENIAFKGYKKEEGILSANIINTGGTVNWALPFAKFIDLNNIVGARINDNKIELVQRKKGTWTTLASGGVNLEGLWDVIITKDRIAVYVDKTLEIEVAHGISGVGYFGISGHQWESDTTEVLTNYSVRKIGYEVTYHGEIVEHNGQPIIIKGYGMALELFDILTYDNQVVENTNITTDDPSWTPVNYFVTPVRESGKYKISMSVIWKLATINKSGMLRYSVDGGTIWKEFQSEPKDKTNDNANLFGLTIDHTGGSFDIRIDMTREAGTASMDCSFCEITVQRVQ